jgi:hypothetical protein
MKRCQLGGCFSFERQPSGEQPVKDHAERVDVGRWRWMFSALRHDFAGLSRDGLAGAARCFAPMLQRLL